MQVYKISYTDIDTKATRYAWVGSERDASAKRKEIRNVHTYPSILSTDAVDVPTKKPELLAFLNENTGKL